MARGRTHNWAVTLAAGAVCLTPPGAQAQTAAPPTPAQAAAQKEFNAGNALMEQHRYVEALPHYKSALASDPNEPALLYDAGLAAYLSQDYKSAAPFWVQLVQAVPEDWRVRAKLVQTYQALGDMKARDAARQSLLDLRKSRKVPELNKQDQFCREQFEVAGQPVFAYEAFDFQGKFATCYKFVVVDKVKDSEKYHILLESDAEDNDLAKETGQLKAGERLFSLDGYYYGPDGRLQRQRVFVFFQHEPTYDETRAAVTQIIEGQLKPLAGDNYGSAHAK